MERERERGIMNLRTGRGMEWMVVFDQIKIFLFRLITILGKNGMLANSIGRNAENQLF